MGNRNLKKICIALIHNRDPKRYKVIRPNLSKLKKELSSNFIIEFFEIAQQPEVIPHKIFMTMFRKTLYWKLNREWVSYRLYKPRNIIFDIFVLIVRLASVYINKKRENRRSVIDTFVSDKHIRAWNLLLERDADLLICFEDDAIFKPTSIQNIKELLQNMNNINKPLYVDFAGGCSPEELRFEKLQLKKDKMGIYYRKPTTNTGCAYMANKLMVEILFLNLQKYPWIRLIAFDWLLNKVFMLTQSQHDYVCYHTYPSIISHGSVTGSHVSWLGKI